MKKLLSMLLVATMVFSLTACGEKNDVEKDSAVDVLTKVWEIYGEDEKFEAVGGGPEDMVEGVPGAFDADAAESLDTVLGYPQTSVALLEDAASLVHMMHANTFTAGAYKLADAAEVEMLVSDLEDNIMSRHWLDGCPDTLIIVQIGEHTVVSVFGNADAVETFKTKLLTVYEEAEIKCEKSLI